MTGGCCPPGTAGYASAPPSPEVVLALPVLEDDGLVVGQLDALAQLDHLLVLLGEELEEQLRREGGSGAMRCLQWCNVVFNACLIITCTQTLGSPVEWPGCGML